MQTLPGREGVTATETIVKDAGAGSLDQVMPALPGACPAVVLGVRREGSPLASGSNAGGGSCPVTIGGSYHVPLALIILNETRN